MGLPLGGGVEQALFLSAATATALNQVTPWVEFPGPFALQATGGVGSVSLEYSVDGGTTAINAQITPNVDNIFPSPVNMIVNRRITGERGVFFRLRCSAYTSGTIAMRLSSGNTKI